jgi:predicted unusual protein kinase regulating ubiquinone biosynthesis (AarF/ABC1/UbiB family)
MKKLKALKTGIISRNLALAKMATKLGKDLYLSKKGDLSDKVLESIFKRGDLLKNELGELKGSFLKAGQMLSMYSQDLLPKEFSNLLTELQNQTSYLDFEIIKKQIPKNILNELTIDPQAMAAASIGQVHKAITPDKQTIVLKVQYKNVEKLIDTDLWILKKILFLLKVVPKSYNFDEVFSEIKKMLLSEMDYEREARNTMRFKQVAEPNYYVPKVYEQFSSKKVLALEFIDAPSVDEYLLTATDQDKTRLAKEFFTLFLKEIYEWKILQSDAHAGNYFIKDGKWVLIDFGATKDINDDLYMNVIDSIIMRDREKLFKTLADDGAIDMENTDLEYFWDYIELISTPLQPGLYNWGESDILKQVMNKVKELQSKIKFNRLPHQNIFIDRKISGVYFMLTKIRMPLDLNALFKDFREL